MTLPSWNSPLLIFKKLSTLFPTIFYHINYMPLEDRYLVMNS